MLRGDDVSDLQHRLNGLGFDAGKEDGIFGPDTAAALTEFQRNAGIAADGIFGPDTAAALGRMSGPRAGTPTEGSVASVREREELRRGEYRLERCKIFVAVATPLDAVGTHVHRALAGRGADIELDVGAATTRRVASAPRSASGLPPPLVPSSAPCCTPTSRSAASPTRCCARPAWQPSCANRSRRPTTTPAASPSPLTRWQPRSSAASAAASKGRPTRNSCLGNYCVARAALPSVMSR